MLQNIAIRGFILIISATLLLFFAVFLVQQATEVVVNENGEWRFTPFVQVNNKAVEFSEDTVAAVAETRADIREVPAKSAPRVAVAQTAPAVQKQVPPVVRTANPIMHVHAIGSFYNNSFIPKSPLSTNERIGIRVEVLNQGNGATGTWMVGFTLPNGEVRYSAPQSPLQAGEHAFIVVDFTLPYSGTYQIPVAFVSESSAAQSRSAIATVSVY